MPIAPSSLGALYFLDFETNKKCEFYLVGLSSDGSFRQIILTARLEGLAEELECELVEPEIFVRSFLSEVRARSGTVIAYSTAERSILHSILSVDDPILDGITYCNLAKAAKAWIRKYKQKEFKALPPLVKSADDFSKKRHPRSLASVCRLIDFKAPTDYAIGKTTSRFNAVISALEKRNQQYRNLTAVQKAKATKAIKHNRYDVESMIALFDVIQGTDPTLIEKAISSLSLRDVGRK
jgi:hypothetical protein